MTHVVQFARSASPARRRAQLAAIVGTLALACTACRPTDTPLAPASAEAGSVSGLWWIFFTVTGIIYLAVMATLLGIVWRKRRDPAAAPGATPPTGAALKLVGAAVGLTVVILFALLVVDFRTGRHLDRLAGGNGALTVKITGHQWWWEVEYDDPVPSSIIQTANELHLPVGRPVRLLLQSADVIHSFWIPSLQGKKDLVPGHPTTLWLHPERVGRFQGQCAEFCGFQHAHMGLLAIVEPVEEFTRWQQAQRQSARAPANEKARHGQSVFLNRSCVLCHKIAGTPAGSRVGPPLTHLAGRETIAATSLPNRREELKRWVSDPQAIKPGVRMPATPLEDAEREALLDYLQGLH